MAKKKSQNDEPKRVKIPCLKCDKLFRSRDPVVNKICESCNKQNQALGGRNSSTVYHTGGYF